MPVVNSAGQGHPYWFEWFVGLYEVVQLLNPNGDTKKVAFQVKTIEGWDDVVVTLKNSRRCYQVKHSRAGESLSFGSLVEKDEKGASLLGDLASGWKLSGLNDKATQLILHTNRKDGTRWSQTTSGNRRPPLLEFWKTLKNKVASATDLSEIQLPMEYAEAWHEWLTCLDSVSDSEKLEFMRSLEIHTKKDDIEGLEIKIRDKLAKAFGISLEKAAPLFDSLCRSLKTWTTGHSGVTVEDLCESLALTADEKELALPPPPPVPFFPSRLPVANLLEAALLDDCEPSVFFLNGEPGFGKTSVVSWLANRRTDTAFQGVVGVRFYCFEPIRPDQTSISLDASRVRAQDLWYSLLTQLREGLKDRLFEFQVPLRNTFLDWREARKHVLRICDLLGANQGRKFVIVIDGIDHAARASQLLPSEVKDFFDSIPGPDEISDKRIRLLISGQPSNYYSQQYPTWLWDAHPNVRQFSLPGLGVRDIEVHLRSSPTKLPREQIKNAAMLINDFAKGNTLGVVFAVAESENLASLDSLNDRLKSRNLTDGVVAYYDSIWKYAIRLNPKLELLLAGAISLARRPLTGEMLEKIFSEWQFTKPAWENALEDLAPLLTSEKGAYQIRHNDVRVYLVSKFKSFGKVKVASVASQLANYLQSADSDRLLAHLQLFDILDLSERSSDKACIFSVDWVMEGQSLGIELSQLENEGYAALDSLVESSNWSNVVRVACGLQTLERLSIDYALYPEPTPVAIPPFLPSEAVVTPFRQWRYSNMERIISDAGKLIDAGEVPRAKALLMRWFKGLTIRQIVGTLVLNEDFNRPNDLPIRRNRIDNHVFKRLGEVCGAVKFHVPCGKVDDDESVRHGIFNYEQGFVVTVTNSQNHHTFIKTFGKIRWKFIASWELVVSGLAKSQAWVAVRSLLDEMRHSEWSEGFQTEATWYALKSDAYKVNPEWLRPLENEDYGLFKAREHTSHFELDEYLSHMNVCRALGWTRLGFATSEIADSVVNVYAPYPKFKYRAEFQLLFESAALLGRIAGLSHENGMQYASSLISPEYCTKLLDALWNRSWGGNLYVTAANIAEELSLTSAALSSSHRTSVEQIAISLAQRFVVGPRMNAIWELTRSAGRLDILKQWVEHHLGHSSETWRLSNQEAVQTVYDFLPYANKLGLQELSNYASSRSSWLRVNYQSGEEHSFEECSKWLQAALKNEPEIWASEGWKLWQICARLNSQDINNYYEPDMLDSISAGAIRCGSNCWWQLISTSFPNIEKDFWHIQTRRRIVNGTRIAIKLGASLNFDEIIPIWSLAVSFSYWFDVDEAADLIELAQEILRCSSTKDQEPLRTVLEQTIGIGRFKIKETKSRRDSRYSDIRDDSAFWERVAEIISTHKSANRSPISGLFEIAFARALLLGNDVLVEGLKDQVHMHTRWTFGVSDSTDHLQTLPDICAEMNWSEIAVQFQRILLNSFSAEVIAAALNGLHILVDHNPIIINQLFQHITDEWARYWLLNSSEVWAVLYPEEMTTVNDALVLSMNTGVLVSRLQAFIVLLHYCKTIGEEFVCFPIPESPKWSDVALDQIDSKLLYLPSTSQGHTNWSNDYSATRNMLKYCKCFDFDFDTITGLVAKRLFELQGEGRSKHPLPQRNNDLDCRPLNAEKSLGDGILGVISKDWCSQESIIDLSHALLANEDSWIYRARPKPLSEKDEWICGYDYTTHSMDNTTRHANMLKAATQLSIPIGWKAIASQVVDYTDSEDFLLQFWFDNSTIAPLKSQHESPTCPGGRSFIWTFGKPFEVHRPIFASALFVGGRTRLHYCNFEMRPCLAWRARLGWAPDPTNPLEWICDGSIVAKYQRYHGILRNSRFGPNHRIPFVDRWIVSDFAFKQMESTFGKLYSRTHFRNDRLRND